MFDAGIANLESYDSKVYGNWIENTKYGIRISLGGSNNEVYGNRFKNPSKCESLRYLHAVHIGNDGLKKQNMQHDTAD